MFPPSPSARLFSSDELKKSDTIKYVFRVLLGILFLFSATAKLIGIDAFEIYVFGFGWFSLGTSFVLARLVIAAEYSLGLLLILNFFPVLAFSGSIAMLTGFTLFLCILMLAGNRDNCHCFGELIDIEPSESIVKNLVMLLLLLPTSGLTAFHVRRKGLWLPLALIVPLAAVLIISPPDNWRYDAYTRARPVDEAALRESLSKGVLPATVTQGEHVVCFYSLKCEFCKMSARKLLTLRERGDFSRAPVIAVFGRGENPDPTPFLEETGLRPDEVHFIDPAAFLRITGGVFPLILVMRGEEIVEAYNYRNLH